MDWTYAIDETEMAEGQLIPVSRQGVNVVLARIGRVIYAVSGKCSQRSCPMFKGTLVGYTITCPCHGWQFDVRTGKFLNAPGLCLEIYPTKSEAGSVFVNLG